MYIFPCDPLYPPLASLVVDLTDKRNNFRVEMQSYSHDSHSR